MWFRYQKFKKVYLGIIFVFVFVSCSEKHKSDLDLRNENKELNSKLKSAKEKENIYKDSLMVIKEELMRFNNNNKTSEASNRNYLYGIPTAPPYKYINLKITDPISVLIQKVIEEVSKEDFSLDEVIETLKNEKI